MHETPGSDLPRYTPIRYTLKSFELKHHAFQAFISYTHAADGNWRLPSSEPSMASQPVPHPIHAHIPG